MPYYASGQVYAAENWELGKPGLTVYSIKFNTCVYDCSVLTVLVMNCGLTMRRSLTVWKTSTSCSVLSLSNAFHMDMKTPLLSHPSLKA